MNRNLFVKSSLLFLGLTTLLAACRPDAVSTPADASSTETLTSTFRSTATMTPTAQNTPTLEPTASATPTPTATIRWDDLLTEQTPLPEFNEVISPENIEDIREFAVWGTGRPNEISLSADGLILAVGTNNGAILYDSLTFQRLSVLHTQSAVVSIAFSLDYQWMALGQNNGQIEIYELEEISLVTRLTPETDILPDISEVIVAFAENGKHLTGISQSPQGFLINRWDTSTWDVDESFKLDAGLTSYIKSELNLIGIFSEDILSLQSLSLAQESAAIPLPETAQELFWRNINTYDAEVISASSGDFILVNTGATIVHWQLLNEELSYLLNDYPQKLADPCYAVPDTCLNLNGEYAWTCGDEPVPPIELIALTPDDIMVLISLNEGRTEFRRASDGMLVWEIDSQYTNVAFSPGSEFFFGVMEDGTIEKRSTLDGGWMDSMNSHPAVLFDMVFSPNGAVLAVGYNDPWIRVYDIADGNLLGVLTGTARSLSFSPDGILLAAGLTDGTVRIFELEAGTFYDLPPGHLGAVTDLAFTADGGQLITSSDDCTVSIWSLADGSRSDNISPDSENPFRISEVEISTRNDLQFVAGNRGIVVRIDHSLTQKITFADLIEVTDLKLSPDESFLSIAGFPAFLLPNPESVLATVSMEVDPGQDEAITSTAFTPDGSLLIQASEYELAFWSVDESALLFSLSLTDGAFTGGVPIDLEISPDGTLVALGTEDGLIHIFGIPSE